MSGVKVPRESRLRYLERRRQEVLQLTAVARDWDFVKKVGHQIKGNAVTFEFPSLTEVGLELEQAALERNEEKVHELCKKLKRMIDELAEQI